MPSLLFSRTALLAGASLAGCIAVTGAAAQSFTDLKTPDSPLVLESQGSFYVGGEALSATPTQLMSFMDQPAPVPGEITVNQMYVEYMVPDEATGVPVVMMHGGTVMGKSYDTTPDGRMGWYEYFVRQGHPVYVPEQVGRARSGTNLLVYNEVRNGERPLEDLPNIFYHANEQNWTLWRFGPAPGEAFPDTQFPVEFADELSKQGVPDFSFTLPDPNPNIAAMAELATQLDGAVLMGHSQTGTLPVRAALEDPSGVRGMILVEPGGCGTADLTDEQVTALAPIPTLIVFGDHLDNDTKLPPMNWQGVYEDCQAFLERINAAGGKVEMLYPPEMGIHGNTHLIMQDKNNLEIADMILEWIARSIPAAEPTS